MTAPLQMIAVSFTPDAGFEGRILEEVDQLQGRGILRILDMLFVAKSSDGTLERLSIGDDEDFGGLLSGIVPIAPGDMAVSPAGGDGLKGFDPADAWALADSLNPGTALAFLLVEHHWATPLFEAISETGGTLLGGGFLSPDAGMLVATEVAAIEEAAQAVAEAQAIEGRALLRAIAAGAEAAEAVAASEAIQSAAAADAIRVLIEVGLLEEAAAREAVSALANAGVIVAAADEAAAEAVARDAEMIAAADEAAAEAVARDAEMIAAADETTANIVAEDAATVEAADETTANIVAEDAEMIEAADEATANAMAEDAATIGAADEVAAEATDEAIAKVRAAEISVTEAQVLRYLPQPVPFSVIAAKLGISRSAAKDRAERLYKKLGVHNRADAVSRARELDLLPASWR
jgi:DNA-binding NarL/FixJ family response regulator